MADYLHGAYGNVNGAGDRLAANARCAMVYVGTAPVHTVEGGAANVNKPVLVRNMTEAKRLFGYSKNWADYTLCEAMHVHFELNGVGPLVLINVLDPATHKEEDGGTASLTPAGGKVTIVNAGKAEIDTLVVKSGATTKVKGTDYGVKYDANLETVTIYELTAGALGTTALTITYDIADPTAVDADDVIGETDGAGLNTGVFAVKNVYQKTGYIPAYLLAPGFSSVPSIHAAMIANATKINGHWDAYVLADLPILNGETPLTLDTIKAYKDANGYNKPNETVYFPLAKGVDGNVYHIATLAAANLQTLLTEQDGIPYRTASNTDCTIIENLYLGEAAEGRVYDDTLINEKLNKNGIASAAFVRGVWAIWGAHSADYDQENADLINVAETSRMMLFYLSNDFQLRRTADVDRFLTKNDLETIVSEEQARLDALVKVGALAYGKANLDADGIARSDVYSGDFHFTFNITTAPLAKSLTVDVNWTDEGFVTYFDSFAE